MIDSFNRYLTLAQGLRQLTVIPLIRCIHITILSLGSQSLYLELKRTNLILYYLHTIVHSYEIS